MDRRHVEADQRQHIFPGPGVVLIEIKVGCVGASMPGLILLQLQITVKGMYVFIMVWKNKKYHFFFFECIIPLLSPRRNAVGVVAL
jgi:hypothetical protein